jgi:hypothetical protein
MSTVSGRAAHCRDWSESALASYDQALAIKPDFAGGNLAKGATLKTKIVVERNPAYAGPINVTFQNLPKGVTAAAAMIAIRMMTPVPLDERVMG